MRASTSSPVRFGVFELDTRSGELRKQGLRVRLCRQASQLLLFLLIPGFVAAGQWLFFEISLFTILTMYGGGFATIPAFLADIFGPENLQTPRM